MYEKTYEKAEKWLGGIANGDENIFAIGYRGGELQCIVKKRYSHVDSMLLATDRGDGLEVISSIFPNGTSYCENRFRLIIKEDNRLIAHFENGDLFSFGFKGAVSNVQKLFFFARVQNTLIIISASKELNAVNVIKKCTENPDVLTLAMFELISNKSHLPVEKEDSDELFG